ncbi:ABC transporter ATP-binding protein [Actibacterium mucosum KCTC 23349]|uniref:ABC transporter ATP-binding protein n=1 Tax=Actibacterium mucosum KCTC 23349 TaxID=1454373 RepID=A0A037ZI91_9RHOB|nr:ABC transporter ATP-binding protein [Actibacterium mucosum]KAJ55823.1 ABC transporter ATP-binding protein [Actibacterium mucosum KCTC 23349]
MSLLTVESLAASYGYSQTLFDVNLSVSAGEVLALMGRNGMGKTTTVRAICRMMPAGGRLEFAGHDLTALSSHKVARLGVGLVPEGRRCFADLTVRENLIAAARSGPWTIATVGTLFPRLVERSGQRAASLSGGEQQMLAIGRALMTNPKLMILDEATEGLAPIIRQEIWAAIARLKRETGMALIVIDKSLAELATVCDRAVIVERGTTVWQGAMDALTPEITSKYVGI